MQYADYAVWQRQRLQGEPLQRLLDYWRERLRMSRRLDLPTDQCAGCDWSWRAARKSVRLPPRCWPGSCENWAAAKAPRYT